MLLVAGQASGGSCVSMYDSTSAAGSQVEGVARPGIGATGGVGDRGPERVGLLVPGGPEAGPTDSRDQKERGIKPSTACISPFRWSPICDPPGPATRTSNGARLWSRGRGPVRTRKSRDRYRAGGATGRRGDGATGRESPPPAVTLSLHGRATQRPRPCAAGPDLLPLDRATAMRYARLRVVFGRLRVVFGAVFGLSSGPRPPASGPRGEGAHGSARPIARNPVFARFPADFRPIFGGFQRFSGSEVP